MSETANTHGVPRIAHARHARAAAALFNYGNIVAVLVPLPLGVLWLAASMVVYAMNRHHPNPKVGHYTQQAAYRIYGGAGAFTAAAIFIPGGGWEWYLGAWALAVAVIVPWSAVDLVRIHRDEWVDMTLEPEGGRHE
ncbi:MAG: hypothetical protein GWO02_11570 [Gammaproteobacteria bacterium]|nr:hypothetical protein [Gammaproteobacteria bacterium]